MNTSLLHLWVAALLLCSTNAWSATCDPRPDNKSLLSSFKWEPKIFTVAGNDGAPSRSSLGFSYDINEVMASDSSKVPIDSAQLSTYCLKFAANGNVAADADVNPANFLKTQFDANYVRSSVSTTKPADLPPGCDMSNPDTLEICRAAFSATSHFITGTLLGSLESDQKFDNRAYTLGGGLILLYKPAWNSFAANANPFDWPFRLIRRATHHRWGSAPHPDAFPNLRLVVERVMPEKDRERQRVLPGKDAYTRVGTEVAMTSPVAMLQGKQLKANFSWRYYKEVDADQAVRAADLDRFRFTAFSLAMDAGWRVTYASGKLPFDRQADRVWELGYRLSLD